MNATERLRHLIILDALYLAGLGSHLAEPLGHHRPFYPARHLPLTFWGLQLSLAGWVGAMLMIGLYPWRLNGMKLWQAPVGGKIFKRLDLQYLFVSVACGMAIDSLEVSPLPNAMFSAASVAIVLISLVFWHWRVNRYLSLLPPHGAAHS